MEAFQSPPCQINIGGERGDRQTEKSKKKKQYATLQVWCCIEPPAVKNLPFGGDHSGTTCQTTGKVSKCRLNQLIPSLFIATFMAFFLGHLFFYVVLCYVVFPPFFFLTYGNEKNPTLCSTWTYYGLQGFVILLHLPAGATARQKEGRRKRSEVE